jgi:hypothetical protein
MLINELPETSNGVQGDAPAPPLDAAERAAATQVARRLAVELRGMITLLPKDDRTASAMSRALQVDRNTCQRLVASVASDDLNESLLVKLPGVQGLRQVIEAVGKRCREAAAGEQLAAAAAAVDALQVLIDRVAGSQRRLRHRLEADVDVSSTPSADDSHARRSLFRAAAELVGRWSDVMTTMSIIRPHASDDGLTDTARVQGRIGHMWRASSVPLEIGATTPGIIALDPVKTEDGAPMQTLQSRPARGDTPDSLLTEFCSTPLPRVTSRAQGKHTIHVIDPSEPASTSPVDIFVGHRRSTPDRHPATIDPPVGEVSSLIVYPARRLLADVFLHRDIARRCSPSTELHLGGFPAGATGHRARWSTRFPGGPRLELLGAGLAGTKTSAYAKYTELTEHVFERLGWDPGHFIGYRIDVTYPVWQAAYCLLFDFGGSQGAAM